MIAYDLHPQVRVDLDEIWDFIAEDSLDAADKVIADILARIKPSCVFRIRATNAPTSPHARCDSFWCMTT
jgi:hypothetical protein